MKTYKIRLCRAETAILFSVLLLGVGLPSALGQFKITYYDSYNYETGQWDLWNAGWYPELKTPLEAWDAKYLVPLVPGDEPKSVLTPHAFPQIDRFKLRYGLWSQDDSLTQPGHDYEGWGGLGQDWNPVRSLGDNVTGQSPCHVFGAVFTGWVYLAAGDVLEMWSDDDAYVLLDGKTDWTDAILSIDHESFFEYVGPYIVPAELEGYHAITVKFMERCNHHSGIQINRNGSPLEAAVTIDGLITYKEQCFANGGIDNKGTANSLDQKLDAAKVAIDRSQPETAVNILQAFLDELDAQSGKHVSPTCAQLLTGYAEQLIGQIRDNDNPRGAKEYLVGLWRLDERKGLIAYDSSGNSNDGVLNGDPVWQPNGGAVKGALLLDGVNDFVSLPIGSLIVSFRQARRT